MNRWMTRLSVGFATLGLLVSVYMTVFKLTENQSMCLGNGGCSIVNNSIYAEVYGVPVAIVGILGYAAILVLLVFADRAAFLRSNAVMLVFGMCLVGFLFTIYLVYVEVALIHALCPFCITSQISMTVLFILSIIRLARESAY